MRLQFAAPGFVGLAFIFASAACGAGSTTGPVSTATGTPPVAPMSADTGLAAVDQLIRIVQARDTAAWVALVQLSPYDCTADSQLTGRPPCLPGEPDGTPVEALPESTGTGVGGCRIATPVAYVRAADLAGVLDAPGLNPARLAGIYRSLASEDAFDVLFARQAPEAGYGTVGEVVHLESGRVTSLAVHCAADLAALENRLPPGDVRMRPAD